MAAISGLSPDFENLRLDDEKKENNEHKEAKNAPGDGSQTKKLICKRLKNVPAHYDDIHAIIKIKGGFVTGSKDGWLKMWSDDGQKEKVVFRPDRSDYTNWITALSPFGSDHWISGTRDGNTDLWDINGKHITTLQAFPSYSNVEHRCKERNAFRINCISQGISESGKPIFYTCWPTEFDVHDPKHKEGRSFSHCVTSVNDFVFSVTQLRGGYHLVVTGERLDVYKAASQFDSWKKFKCLIADSPKKGRDRLKRPFISTVTALASEAHCYSLAIFGGEVSIMNIEVGKKTRIYKEHHDRVWTTVELPNLGLLSSCSDDRTIKLWDLRLDKSIQTLTGNIDRVSTLLPIDGFTLVSGSCPKNVSRFSRTPEALLSFWDLRMT